jgi:dTDP-4-dehydrorhamnose 3,5-epimerase
MKVSRTDLPGVLLIEPKVFGDDRGFFVETYRRSRYTEAGAADEFVQDNLSSSARGVLRGLHYQNPKGQAKLVQVFAGEIWDVVVDVRSGSPTIGRWVAVTLSSADKRQLYVPAGFAHGFCTTSETALVSYKTSEVYAPECEVSVAWNDPDLGIDWPISAPTLSDKDRLAPRLRDIPAGRLPPYEGS